MTKSVKELIYDYLGDGKEAYVAKKMYYFDKVRSMFNDLARDRDGVPMRNKHGPSGINPLTMLVPMKLGSSGRGGRRFSKDIPEIKGVTLRSSRIPTWLEDPDFIQSIQKQDLVGRGFTAPQIFWPDYDIQGAGMHHLPNVMMSPCSIRRRLDDEKLRAIRDALHGMLQRDVKIILADTGYDRALEAAKGTMASWGAEVMLKHMRGMHGTLPSIAHEWDGDVMSEKMYNDMQSKEKTMNYSIKLLTTELFHNEVILLQNLADAFNVNGNIYYHFQSPVDKFEALLKSMADLGLSTLTVDNHEFINALWTTSYFDLEKIKMTVTAPTNENPNVILTFVVAPERELVDVPAFAVEICAAEEIPEGTTLNADVVSVVMQYHTMLSLIAAGIEYNHIPLRASIVDRFLERRAYVATTRDRTIRRSGFALDLPTIMLTAGKSVEQLLANNVLRAEYLERMKSLGIEVAEMEPYDATARFDVENDRWMVHPVILGNLEQRFTIAVSEDQIMDIAIPRIYEKARGTLEREKALRFAGEFFGTERLDNKAE